VVDEPQLPRVPLVNFLAKFSPERKRIKQSLPIGTERPRVRKMGGAHTFSDASLMQLWKRSMTWLRLRRLCCGAAEGGASEAARERRRTDAARAAARARARSSWSSLEPSGNADGGDCNITRAPTVAPRAAGGGVGSGAGTSSAGGILER
jgi:hypothetical protein